MTRAIGPLGLDTKITLLAAGLIFLLALVLGVWKYRQIMTSDDHRAHPYVDISHRAALLYSFATLLIAAFVDHGARRDTVNQFEKPARGTGMLMAMLIVGEIGGFGVIFAGFIAGQLC
ncbi:hypothetical protein OK015_01060 [Mycobacterium sp. Aquia_216]|uniref:hypothetical protein n=1 Tax=Mycobacterium sp. Aquia_216 TaxID=2991729 RepID=UPI00227B61D3|nr:hypothetical protein [Mycobacterium sp. Aquia_216]WAJ45148.1 hypothetical protein OK015_01060 [Mycobacterium sp. Aquia_216]